MSFISGWKQFAKIQSLAYEQIDREFPCVQAEPWYVWVRSLLILGDLPGAQMALQKAEAPRSFFQDFLSLQLQTLLDPDTDQTEKLWSLAPRVPEDPYFQAEFHFFLGFAHNLANDFRSGVRHHRMAVDLYLKSQLPGCAAIALYNTCIAYNHLNSRSAYEDTYQAFSKLVEENPLPTLKQLLFRIRAYRAIDRQDHASAMNFLTQAFYLSQSVGRWRDLGGICVHLEIESRMAKKTASIPDYSSFIEKFSPSHQKVLEEIHRLDKTEFPSQQFLRQTLRLWRTHHLESIHQLSLAQLLVEKIFRGGDWETCLWLSRWASKTSLNHQQALSLWDFRYFEGMALFHLGERSRSARLFSAYQADSANHFSSLKKERQKNWETLLQQSGKNGTPSLTLDNEEHSLEIGNRQIDLKRKPILERFFQLIISQTEARSVGEFFESLYQTPYNPLLHERRWNSIVDRARKLVKHPNVIIRRSGQVGLAKGVHSQIVGQITGESVETRRKVILKTLQRHQTGVTISKLEEKFSVSRRTLQSDLQFLMRKNLITRQGRTHHCRYEKVKEAL